MAHYLKAGTLALALCLTAGTGASAGGVSGNVDQLVNDCVYSAGVRGSYHVTPAKYGSTAAYSVPASGDVSTAQSKQINQCIARSFQAKPKPKPRLKLVRRTATALPDDTAGCLAEYKHKLRTTGNGRNYRGDNVGTRLVAGLFGKRLGRQLIENEYDRCLNRVAYYNDRCPTGAFVGGGDYCIKRPYR